MDASALVDSSAYFAQASSFIETSHSLQTTLDRCSSYLRLALPTIQANLHLCTQKPTTSDDTLLTAYSSWLTELTTIAAVLEANLKKKPHVGEKPQSKESKAKLPVRVSQTKVSTAAIEPGELISWTPSGYLGIRDPEKDLTRIYLARMDKQGLVEDVKKLKEVKRRVTFMKEWEDKLLVDADIYCLINGQL
jgi:hypothetical protein